MKKILVTGAAGAVGLHLIKYLLAEGKYEVTALDLKNKKVYKRLKRLDSSLNINDKETFSKLENENNDELASSFMEFLEDVAPQYRENVLKASDYIEKKIV